MHITVLIVLANLRFSFAKVWLFSSTKGAWQVNYSSEAKDSVVAPPSITPGGATKLSHAEPRSTLGLHSLRVGRQQSFVSLRTAYLSHRIPLVRSNIRLYVFCWCISSSSIIRVCIFVVFSDVCLIYT